MEEIRYTEAFSENLLTKQAYLCGFLGFYPLRRTLGQPELFALLMAVLSHFALDYGAIRSEWLRKIGRLASFLQSNPDFVHRVTPDFWREAIAAMKEIALETLVEAGKAEFVAKLRNNGQFSVSEGQEVVLIVGRRLQLRVVMLLEENKALFMKDDCPEFVPSLWTMIGVRDNGDFYFFIDLNFRRGRECSRFPFYCESVQEIVAFQGFAVIQRQTKARSKEVRVDKGTLHNGSLKLEREAHAVEKCEEDLEAMKRGQQRESASQCPKLIPEVSKSLPPKLSTQSLPPKARSSPFSSAIECSNCSKPVPTARLLNHRRHPVCVPCLCDKNCCPHCEGELDDLEKDWVKQRA